MILSNKILPRVLVQVLPIMVVVMLALGYFAHQTVRQSALDVHQKRLEQVAAQSSTALAVRLQNVVDTAHALAANDLVINSLIDLTDREGYIPTLFQSLGVPGSNSARVSLVDYRGRHVASNAPELDHSDAAWIPNVMGGHELIRTDAGGMIVAVPILFEKLAEGMILVELDARGFSELVALPVQADGYAITTFDGGTIYTSADTLLPANGPEDGAEDGSESWMSVSTLIAGFPNLSLVIGDRMATVLVPIERQETFFLVAILLSILAVGIGIFATAIKVVIPIRQFISGVESVSSSADLGYRIEPFGAEEFRRLTGSFNNMLADIESTTTSRDYTDGILNSMNEFLLVVSDDGRIQSANRAMARALGCRADDLVGRQVSSLVTGDWREPRASLDDDRRSVECRLITGESSNIPVLVSVSPMHPDKAKFGQPSQAKPTSLILVLKDITEQIRDKAQLDRHVSDLERSNADLQQFAYVASHDLKAPLRAIDNLAGWIDEDLADQMSGDSRKHITLLRSRVKRLEALLDGLLRYARAGRDETELSYVDTGLLVSEAVELLGQPEVLHVDIPGNMPWMQTSAAALQQVFRNLIGNAAKHRDGDTVHVTIGCRNLGDVVEFSVADNGPGIPEEFHHRIFQMFQTLKRRDEVEGSGLGLALVQKLVRANGGEINVESPDGEKGSVFRFTWADHISKSEQEFQMERKNVA